MASTTPHIPRIESSPQRKQRIAPTGYMPLIADEETERPMLYWLAEACKEAREETDRGQAGIAASLANLIGSKTNQSTIDRFEKHENQPRSIDATVSAYADDLDLDPRQLWARALELWIANEGPSGEHASRAVQHARAATQHRAPSQRQSHSRPASKRRKPAAG